jgi:adenosylcobinamide-phosphate synthase
MSTPFPGVDAFTGIHPFGLGWLLVVVACGLDRLVGDPRWCPHPVVVMGWWISRLQQLAEGLAGDRPWALRLGGGLITAALVGGSGLAGWGLEQLALAGRKADSSWGAAALAMLSIALASALAGRSLEQAVRAVLAQLPASPSEPLTPARQRLAWIVGRDTERLDRVGILRALAETASENAVDGLFAPLFWMLVGAWLWGIDAGAGPGPLALAWGFKAASTLDSMLGYRRGRLQWLGTAGARLDDLLVWLPCRLVSLSLPLVAGWPLPGLQRWWAQVRQSWRDGRPDPSPNAGLSQAAYAHATGVQLGGVNHYAGIVRSKPLLAAGRPLPDQAAVLRMLALSRRLELLWLLAPIGAGILAETVRIITKTLS